MGTERRFEEETEYWVQQLFEAWDDVFQDWPSDDALELVASVDLLYAYNHHIQETWDEGSE